MAYLPRWPRKLAFYCRQPPATGGETIIADVRRFEQLVDGRMRDEIAANGVLYVRNFRSEEHTSELQSLMRISYAVFCLKKKKHTTHMITHKTVQYRTNHQ